VGCRGGWTWLPGLFRFILLAFVVEFFEFHAKPDSSYTHMPPHLLCSHVSLQSLCVPCFFESPPPHCRAVFFLQKPAPNLPKTPGAKRASPDAYPRNSAHLKALRDHVEAFPADKRALMLLSRALASAGMSLEALHASESLLLIGKPAAVGFLVLFWAFGEIERFGV
jgi:hypothetical protein